MDQTDRVRLDVIGAFETAPGSALFDQRVVAAVAGITPAALERRRWKGVAPDFIRVGSRVRYRKADVEAWLNRGNSRRERR